MTPTEAFSAQINSFPDRRTPMTLFFLEEGSDTLRRSDRIAYSGEGEVAIQLTHEFVGFDGVTGMIPVFKIKL